MFLSVIIFFCDKVCLISSCNSQRMGKKALCIKVNNFCGNTEKNWEWVCQTIRGGGRAMKMKML